ncbi:MAG: histidine phosphatase family protein [Gammaproteobacteria bacterium]|nr:histidine phosphatase family protein [Gammaproteobacteria bacterium]
MEVKTLFLLRHAKSSWDYPRLRDFERPLAARGSRDAPIMGRRFIERGASVDCIISSPAARARATALLLAEAIGFPIDDVVSNPDLYFCGTAMYLKAASLVEESCESAMLVGHNPTITDFANEMTNAGIANIPTCGLVEMTLPIDHWPEISPGTATLAQFDFPKGGD